jgi:hypothetical protein
MPAGHFGFPSCKATRSVTFGRSLGKSVTAVVRRRLVREHEDKQVK